MSRLEKLHADIKHYGEIAYRMLSYLHNEEELKNITKQVELCYKGEITYEALESKLGKDTLHPALAMWFLHLVEKSIPPVDGKEYTVSAEDMANIAIKMFDAGMAIVEAGWKPAELLIDRGQRHTQRQKDKASKPRSVIPVIVELLAKRYPKDSPRELWPRLFSILEEEFDSVEELIGNRHRVDTWKYQYTGKNDNNRYVTFTYFRNIIGKFRKTSQ